MKTDTTDIRKATADDIDAVEAIYTRIHEEERQGKASIGWDAKVYPVRATAVAALERGDLFVCCGTDGNRQVMASAIINRTQVPEYADGHWLYAAADSEVMVLHTLTVDPLCAGRGIGRRFVEFYEDHARQNGCHVLRLDTNARNAVARQMYARLGYREADIVPCTFNDIPDVQLVLLEKNLTPIWEQMTGGKPYFAGDKALIKELERTREELWLFNSMRPSQHEERMAILRRLLGSCGKNLVLNQPVRFDYGSNIHIGDNVVINFNLTVLDEARVSIGNNVFIGPNVSIYTACHPTDPEERNKDIEWSEPVTIGNSVWIGGSATVCPGVTIGEGCVIGAGSVVVKDIPPYSIAVGNPCRVVKKVK